jgi:hypothetical protein
MQFVNFEHVCAAQALELPFTPAFLQPSASFTRGANFASAGSGLLDSTSAGKVKALSTDTNISLFLFHSLDPFNCGIHSVKS